MSTFATLRALHTIIGGALDDIHRVYTQPPPSSSASAHPGTPFDFPCPNALHDPEDPAEQLRTHPLVSHAISKVVAAAGQISTIVQFPMMTLADASMACHLSSCLGLLEKSNVVELLREAGPNGLHTNIIAQHIGVDSSRLAHIFRLLATHHILLEREPDVFTLTRISSLLDTGKPSNDLEKWRCEGRPEVKYHATNGIAALIGHHTDVLFKSAAYLNEAYLHSRAEAPIPPFQYGFQTNVPVFPWLEGQGVKEDLDSAPTQTSGKAGPGKVYRAAAGEGNGAILTLTKPSLKAGEESLTLPTPAVNPNHYRFSRFGSAMEGSRSWEVPGAILHGFDWRSLPRESIVVDVGGGIGNTSMLLADAFLRPGDEQDTGIEIVIQDRPAVVEMGKQTWRAKYPELLEKGRARFQAHDFLTPQLVQNAAVFFVRMILHNWPDAQARRILEHLREAATENTKLLIADFVLPLACPDTTTIREGGEDEDALVGIEGAEMTLALPPLLANLGKANAHVYWVDMAMQALCGSKERTLREIVTLAKEAGWKVVRVARAEGSLLGYITAVPVDIPSRG